MFLFTSTASNSTGGNFFPLALAQRTMRCNPSRSPTGLGKFGKYRFSLWWLDWHGNFVSRCLTLALGLPHASFVASASSLTLVAMSPPTLKTSCPTLACVPANAMGYDTSEMKLNLRVCVPSPKRSSLSQLQLVHKNPNDVAVRIVHVLSRPVHVVWTKDHKI